MAIPLLLAAPALGQTFSGLGFLPGDSASWGLDISEDGTTVIGQGAVGTTSPHHWRWTSATGLQPLGAIAGYDGESRPGGVSRDGSVITGSVVRNADGGRLSYRWTSAGIAPLDGGFDSTPTGVSSDGMLVFGSDALEVAFRYTQATGRQSLGPLMGTPLGGAGHSLALAGSQNGAVLVGGADARRQTPLPPIYTPFAWTVST